MLNFLFIYHYNISLQCNSGAAKGCRENLCDINFVLHSSGLLGHVTGGKGVTNTLLNILNSYYIATLFDITIVNVNLVENIIFYVASSIEECEIVESVHQ